MLLASDWQNPGQPLDVSQDLSLSPLDVLIGINRLNRGANRTFPIRAAGSSEPYYDVDGNGLHNPLDILLVINALNSRKPTVAVKLLNDTGVGLGANADRITNDISVRGAIRLGAATQLWGRMSSDTDWRNFTPFVSANQSFSIPQSELVKALGRELADGNHTLRFQTRFGANFEQLGAEVDLPVTLDTSSRELNIAARSNTPSIVTVSSQGVIEVPLGERASPSSLLASKVKLYDSTFDQLQPGAVEITPRGVSLSSDGRTLLIDPPTNTDSTRYLIAVGEGGFEDAAGNRNLAFDAFANQFNHSTSSPIAWNRLTFATANQRRVAEYTFSLDRPDLFMLNGLRSTSSAQVELYAPSGKIYLQRTFDASGGTFSGVDSSIMLTEVGEYRLRIAIPRISEVVFNPALASLLPNVPSTMTVSGDWRLTHVYTLPVSDVDRVFFKNNLSGEAHFNVSMLDPFGRRVESRTLNRDTVFDVSVSGRYVVFIEPRPFSINSFDYSIHLRKSTEHQLTLGQLHQQPFNAVGQQAIYSFPVVAGRHYSLTYESPHASIQLFDPSRNYFVASSLPNDTFGFMSYRSGQSFVKISFDRSDIASTVTKLYVTSSEMTYLNMPPETVRVEPLQEGVTHRDFSVPNEVYEFTFNANANELFALSDGQVHGFNNTRYSLIAPSGATIPPVDHAYNTVFYRTPYSGQYRLRSRSGHFQWQSLATAPTLPSSGDVHGASPDAWFSLQQFTATDPRFYIVNTNASQPIAWRLIDSRSRVFNNDNYFNGQVDSLAVGEKYSLLIEKSIGTAEFKYDFRRLNPVTSSRSAAVGELISGVLAGRGDRQVIELDLAAGELIQLTSNLPLQNVRVRWLDFYVNQEFATRVVNPEIPDRIASSRKYRVEIENFSSGPLDYAVEFNTVQPPSETPSQLSGFDVIRSGSVGANPKNFEFDVSAGTMYRFDWLLPSTSTIGIELQDPSGNLVPTFTYDHNIFHVADTSGVIKLKLTNLGNGDAEFSFRMLSPSTAEPITLGMENLASVVPYGMKLFKIPLAAPTELFLADSGNDYGAVTRLYRKIPSSSIQFYEELSRLGQFFENEGLVVVNNDSSETFDTKFTVHDVASFSLLPLNTSTTFASEHNRRYLFPFQTSAPVTLSASDHFSILDQGGNVVAPDKSLANSIYNLKTPGMYRAIVTGAIDFATGNSDSTTFELRTQVVAEKAAAIGDLVSDNLTHSGDIHRYRFNLDVGTPLVLGTEIEQGRFVRWIAPDGEVVAVSQQRGWDILPVYLAGEYQLEVYANFSHASYKFQLTDLSQLAPLTLGNHTGTTTPEVPTIMRISGLPNQVLDLQYQSNAMLTLVDRLGNPLRSVEYLSSSKYMLPRDGQAYMLIAQRFVLDPSDFTFKFNLLNQQSSSATLGQPIFGTLPMAWSGRSYSFYVDRPTWLRAEVQSSGTVQVGLRLPNGISRLVDPGLYTLVLAGEHQLQISNESLTAINFRLAIDLLDQTSPLPLDQFAPVNSDRNYQIEVPEYGRYELQLRDKNNVTIPTSAIRILNTLGEVVAFDEASRGTLHKDSYWITFRNELAGNASEYSIRLARINTTHASLVVGELTEFNLDPSGTQEYLVRMPMALGARYLIEQVGSDDSASVKMKQESEPSVNWSGVDRWLIRGGDGTDALLFRISGTGRVKLRVVDLNTAMALPLNAPASARLDATVRAQAWRINGAVGNRIDFINDSAADKQVTWMIVDEAMNVITQNSNRPLSLSILNRQRFALIVLSSARLDSTLTLPFRSVVY